MTEFNYANSANTATRLLTRFGRDITHRAVSEGTYNTSTSTYTNTETNTTVKACDFDFKEKANGQSYFDSALVQQGDRYALVAPSIANIDTSDKLVIDGVIWNIINVKKLAPAGVLVLWTLHIRK